MFNLYTPYKHIKCRVDQVYIVAMDATPRAFLTVPDR